MSKKIISLMLAMALSASMVAVAAVSVSADTDSDGYYVPSEGTETYRYYFYMPQRWENEFTTSTGAYWWEGTDLCETWQDMYKVKETENENIFCIDVPTDVPKLIFNNYVDGGADPEAPQYTKAAQTSDVTCVDDDGEQAWGYWPKTDEDDPSNELYPEGIRNFNNMIYVIDENRIEENPLNQKLTCRGQWYYYYGNGEYGYTPVKGDGAVYNTEYMSFEKALKDKEDGVKPTPTEPDSTVATTEAVETTASEEATTAPAPVSKPALTVNAKSNVFSDAKAVYDNSTKQVTVTYYLGTDRDLVNLEWYLKFDNTVLEYNNKSNLDATGKKLAIMPQIPSGYVFNTSLPGKINSNASDLGLYAIDSKKPFIQVTFDVIGEPENVETTIDLDVRVLTTGELDPDKMQVDASTMNSFVVDSEIKDPSVLKVANTTLTESTYVAPTVPETTKATETTKAPETTKATETTKASETTIAPATEDATSSTGATVKPGTADTANNGNNTTNNDNGTVKTGDATLAVVILTLLVSATGVMFVIRKREML
jgi:hypothetical protein